MPEVSIIVATYNADWQKLMMTINSIIIQSGVKFEIIFADDGSKIKWNDKIRRYLPDDIDGSFVDAEKNVGTVLNIANAVNRAKGKYIKVISPGDCFNGCEALRKWVDFMKKSDADLSFCNAVYYTNIDRHVRVISQQMSPKNIELYHKKNNQNRIFIDYLLANDSILGASVMAKKDIFFSYLTEIKNRVKYAEDYMIRLMVYDRKKIYHINCNLIWYEYGEGISTTQNNKWAILLYKDFEEVNDLIKKRNTEQSNLHERYRRFLTDRNIGVLHKIKKIVMFPSMIGYRWKMKFSKNTTPIENVKFLNEMMQYERNEG